MVDNSDVVLNDFTNKKKRKKLDNLNKYKINIFEKINHLKNQIIIVNLSGRGDKDINTVAQHLGFKL